MKFNAQAQRWLKAFHLIFVCFWVGAAACMFALYFIKSEASSDSAFHAIDLCIHIIDWRVLILVGVDGCLLTGLLYGFCTGWGFFKQRWLLVKWLATVSLVSFGFLFLGQWELELLSLSEKIGLQALEDPTYLSVQAKYFWFGTLQLICLLILILISTLKPWKRKTT